MHVLEVIRQKIHSSNKRFSLVDGHISRLQGSANPVRVTPINRNVEFTKQSRRSGNQFIVRLGPIKRN